MKQKSNQGQNTIKFAIIIIIVLFAIYLFYTNITFQQQSNNTTNQSINQLATRLKLINSNQLYYIGGNVSLQVILLDSTNKPVADATLLIKNIKIIGQNSTGEDGTITFVPDIKEAGNYTFEISYQGNESYGASSTKFTISVLESSSSYQVDPLLLSRFETFIVIVESPFAIGSGVIIGHEDGKTIVLTSRDIVDGVSDPSQVTVTTNDGKIPAINITFASNGLNLAFVYIDALFGSVAISNAAVLGEDILSVAFDSASAGVVTGFSNATTSNNYPYQIINTNTDPSSGAGVFSDNSGNLIGIVTSDGSDLVVIDIGALSGTNSTNSTNPGGIVSCDPTDPECMACLQGQQNFILINDTVYCCGPGDYIFEDGIWSCR